MGLLEKRYNRILDPTLCAYLLTLSFLPPIMRVITRNATKGVRERGHVRVYLRAGNNEELE